MKPFRRTHVRSLLSVAAVLTVALPVGIGPSPAAAQTAQQPAARDDRVEVIMEGLPPRNSQAYRSILKTAGDAKGQQLRLTRCEVWKVRRKFLDRLKQAARRHKVNMRQLDETWNNVLQPVPKGTAMNAKSRTMIDASKKVQSTADVKVMAARSANMVEYALTKDMQGGKQDPKHPYQIKIALGPEMTVTAVRRKVEIKGERCVWRGVVAGSQQPVTIMWWASGRMTGTIHYKDRIYQLRQLNKDVIGIVETDVDKMPDEHPRMSPEMMKRMNMKMDHIFRQGDASPLRPQRGDTLDQQDDAPGGGNSPRGGVRLALVNPKAGSKAGSAPKGGKNSGAGSTATIMDVLVVYTPKAASYYSDITKDLIELALDDTNMSFEESGISNVRVRLAAVRKVQYAEASGELFDHVWRMVDRGDGYLEEVPALRDRYKADVVILVVGESNGCGLATRVAAGVDEAYAVVNHQCAATTYSFTHELGHILGARHDRLLDNADTPFPFGHGYIQPAKQWRTLMSYKKGCDGCLRLPIWSTPAKVVEGAPAGDSMQDNARVIRENAMRVSNFR
ncbi:MAG: M12 family metallo-peptidase [Hyphomicrobiaceae bacterium]